MMKHTRTVPQESNIDHRKALKQWLLQKNPALAPANLDYTTPLIKNGILTSLQLMEFIVYLERLSDRDLCIDDLKPAVFLNIETVQKNFFGVYNRDQ